MATDEMLNSDYIFTKEELTRYMEIMKPSGFTLDNNLFYVKNEPGKIITLSFGMDEDYPFDVRFGALGVSVCFEEVEQIFYQVYQNHKAGLPYPLNLTSDTFYTAFREDIIGQEGYYFLLENTVWNEASFYTNKPYLDRMMQAGLQFLDKYKTLQDFYNFAEALPPTQLANFYNQPLPPRRMIVKKLLATTDYEEYSTRIVNNYNQRQPGSAFAAFVTALKAYLDTL